MQRFILLAAVTLATSHAGGQTAPSAEQIMKKNYVASKVKDSKSESVFRLIDSKGEERVRKTLGFTRQSEGSQDSMRIISFTSPADIKGTKTLMIEHSGTDDDMWIYLPAMKKTRRLVSSNKKDSFIGTDFSYGDVMGYKVEDWTHKMTGQEKLNEVTCYVVESVPANPEVAKSTGYSKRVSWIDPKTWVTLKGQFFDSSSTLLKEITAEKVTNVDKKENKWQPMVITASNVQTGRKTIIEFKQYKANAGVPKNIFTPSYLEKN